jgi:hypothetical protein
MNDSQLDRLIKSCGSCHAPPRFPSDVWNRIAIEPDSAGSISAWKSFLTETLARLSQPLGIFATCAAFVIAGALIGLGSRPESLPSEVQYIQFVSPFIHPTGR